MPHEREQRARWRHLPLALLLLLTAALFFPLLRNPGPPVGLDLPAWTAIGHLLETQVIADQGWFVGTLLPSVGAGQQVGSTYSLNLMLLWLFNLVLAPGPAAKLPCVLAALVLAHGFYRVACLHATPHAAVLGALLVVLANGELMLQGMWYDLLAVGLALHFWPAVLVPERPWNARRWLLAVALLALTIYAHPMGVIMAVVLLLAAVVLLLRGGAAPGRLRRAGLVALVLPVTLLIGAPQVAGLLDGANAGIQVPSVEWAQALARLLELSGFRASDGRLETALVAVVLLGLLALAGRLRRLPRDFLLPLALLALVVVFIMLQRPLMALASCCKLPFAVSLAYYADRFTHLWGVLVMLLFAVLLSPRPAAPATRRLGNAGAVPSAALPRTWATSWRGWRPSIAGVLLIAVWPLTLYMAIEQLRSPMQLTLETIRERADLASVWSYLRVHPLPGGERVCLEPTFDGYRVTSDGGWPGATTRLTHVFDLTPLFVPGVDLIGGSMYVNRFNEQYMGRSGSFLGVDPQRDARAPQRLDQRMALLHCRQLVAHSLPVRAMLRAQPQVRQVLQAGSLAVFERDAPAPETRLQIVRVDSSSYRLLAGAAAAPSAAAPALQVLPLAFSRHWQASWNGVPLALDEFDALLRVRLPADPAQGSGWLRYRTAAGRVTALVMLAMGLLVAALVAANFAWLSGARVGARAGTAGRIAP